MPSVQKTTTRGVTSGPTVDWVNPMYITACDNTYTYAPLSYGSVLTEISDYIRADGFNFDIPLWATIDGIIGTLTRKASDANVITDYSVVPLKNGSVPAGSDEKKDTSTWWSTSDEVKSYGSPTDLWGTTWTPSDINHIYTGFGVRAEFMPSYGSATAYVDCMKMTVYYTDADSIKYGTTSVIRIYHGTTEIQHVYKQTTQII